jgi:hypothetical protein
MREKIYNPMLYSIVILQLKNFSPVVYMSIPVLEVQYVEITGAYR